MSEQTRYGYNEHRASGVVPPMPRTPPRTARPPLRRARGSHGAATTPGALSIASLCCGIASLIGFGFFLLPQLAAVVLGHLALNRASAGRGAAMAGLVLGYTALAITVLVVLTLGVAFSKADFISR